ncbi:MAG: hypothetical protein JW829_10945 [Pirellulales bacterium]|nr:hypothetical protein [Pirellulales bacterium]
MVLIFQFRAMAKPYFFSLCTLMALLVSPPARPVESGESRDVPAEPPVVIPFDFESKFDDGRYGRILGDLIWRQLQKRGGTILPESMLDVRDWSEGRKFLPGPSTPLSQMQTILRDDFNADVGIWGKVERVAGLDEDVYDVWIRIADFSGAEPRIIYQTQSRTKTVSEIPHVLVKTALDRFLGTPPAIVSQTDPQCEIRWRRNPNLVQGDFEKGDGKPAGWDPLPPHVSLQTVHGGDGSINRIIQFELPEDVAASTGVLYYSDYFPVEENATYRFQCRWRSTGSGCKVFIKCYDTMESQFQEKNSGPDGQKRQDRSRKMNSGTGSDTYPARERREVYRSQQNLIPQRNADSRPGDYPAESNPSKREVPTYADQTAQWHVHTEDFTPQHPQFTPRWGRVMLYAYWPAGTVQWDEIIVKKIAPPPKESH